MANTRPWSQMRCRQADVGFTVLLKAARSPAAVVADPHEGGRCGGGGRHGATRHQRRRVAPVGQLLPAEAASFLLAGGCIPAGQALF